MTRRTALRSILVASSLLVAAVGCGTDDAPVVAGAPDERGDEATTERDVAVDDDPRADESEAEVPGDDHAGDAPEEQEEPPAPGPTQTTPPPTAPPEPPADDAVEEPAPVPVALTLYVSNQSFEDATVHLTVWLDDVVVVDEPFEVGNQHNWKTFTLDLRPGEHRLRATADTGPTFEAVVETGTEPRWADLSYWWNPDDPPRRFSFGTHDEQPAFG